MKIRAIESSESAMIKDLGYWITKEIIEENGFSTRQIAYAFLAEYPKYRDIELDAIRNEIAKNLNRIHSGAKESGIKSQKIAKEGITTDFATAPINAYMIYASFKRGYNDTLVGQKLFPYTQGLTIDIRGQNLSSVLNILENNKNANGDTLLSETNFILKSPALPASFIASGADDVEIRLIVKGGMGLSSQDINNLVLTPWAEIYKAAYIASNPYYSNIVVDTDYIEALITNINMISPNFMKAGLHSKQDPNIGFSGLVLSQGLGSQAPTFPAVSISPKVSSLGATSQQLPALIVRDLSSSFGIQIDPADVKVSSSSNSLSATDYEVQIGSKSTNADARLVSDSQTITLILVIDRKNYAQEQLMQDVLQLIDR
jgi:hypothetical protein